MTAGENQIAIFIDEVDSVINYDFSDDFFAAIRALYNRQATDQAFGRLTFVLSGTVAPYALIKDQARTPFNVGRRIRLDDLKLENARLMLQGLPAQQGEAILKRIFYWTNGHPYLTQKIGQAIARSEGRIWTDEEVYRLVQALFLTERALSEENNLLFVRDRILSSPHKGPLLALYRRVYRARKRVKNDEQSTLHNDLKLAGLVRVDEAGDLTVRNRIYGHAFDQAWIKQNQVVNWWRRPIFMALLISLVILSLLAFRLWLAPQPVQVLAESYINDFQQTTNPTLRLDNLTALYALPGYEAEAEALFNSLPLSEQQALFDQATPDLLAQAQTVITHTYTTLYANDLDAPHASTPLLEAMLKALRQDGKVKNQPLIDEIRRWLAGRKAALRADYRVALAAYNQAITSNGHNPATHFERALVLISLGEYEAALADLEFVLASDTLPGEAIVNAIFSAPALPVILAQASVDYPDLYALMPLTTICVERHLKPGDSASCLFTSGFGKDRGRQKILLEPLSPGRYTLTLENAPPTHSDTWLMFDYLALLSNQERAIIFEIGHPDAPPDYTRGAFKEFCDPKLRADCTTEFRVGDTTTADFVNGLYDWNYTTVEIHFEITASQAAEITEPAFIISTLYATHGEASGFKMWVRLVGEVDSPRG